MGMAEYLGWVAYLNEAAEPRGPKNMLDMGADDFVAAATLGG